MNIVRGLFIRWLLFRSHLSSLFKKCRRRWSDIRGFGRKYRSEILLAVAAISGWSSVTWALVSATEQVWIAKLMVGLFLLCLCGIRYLAHIFWVGIYHLSKGG